MRVLLVLAAGAVAALLWPRGEIRHARRSPMAGARTAMAAAGSTAGGALAPAVSPGGVDPSGVERGWCVLRVRLLDEATGKPFSSAVELWRLDLPENESWTAGDHLQAATDVYEDGRAFGELPAGRYRLAVLGQSFLAEDDPPAFLVRGAVTDMELAVRAPRSHQAFLRVFDERGREHRAARLRHGGWVLLADDPTFPFCDPTWARRRRPKRACAAVDSRTGVSSMGLGHHGYHDASWTDAGFDLGRCREDTGRQRGTARLSLLLPGHTAVMVDLDGRLSGDRTYLAVSVSLDEIKDHVFLPDGRRAAAAGALFEARSDAIEKKPSLSADAWRSLPVSVRVALGGYELLAFEYRVDRPPDPQVMRPSTQG